MQNNDYLDSLLQTPILYFGEIAPKGDILAFAWKNVHENVDVFYVDLTKDSKPIALTRSPEMTLIVNFFPKSRAVLVQEDKSRNERVRLFRVNIDDPLNMIPLTEDNPEYFMRGGEIHPSEKSLFYGINYDVVAKKEIEPTWIYRHDLASEERVVLAKPTKPCWPEVQLSKGGRYVLYHRKELHPKGQQAWVVDVDGKEDREILNFGEKAKVFAKWLYDSKRIVFLTDTKEGVTQKHYSLGICSHETGEIVWIIDDPNRQLEDFRVSTLGEYIIATEFDKTKPKNTIISLETMEQTTLPLIEGNLQALEPLSDEKWLGMYYSSTQPREYVKFSLNDPNPQNFQPITKVWDYTPLTKKDFTAAKDFNWRGKDGLPIHGWLYRPKKPNSKTIVYVHGGPTSSSKDAINPQIQYYAKLGFTVLDPNYRGSTGYGLSFEDAIRKCGWGADEQTDILAGIEALIEKGFATKGKIGITGTSYGGYSSWFAITKFPKEFIAAAVPICGMTDLVVDYETTRPDLRPYSEQMLGGSPTDVPEVYFERSPINFIEDIAGKLLIVQGAQDPNVSPENVAVVKKKLAEFGIAYDLLVFDDEGHGILKTKNQKQLYQKIAAFMDQL